MTDKPILFSGPMIRALLDGRKSQTRRVLKPQPPEAPASAWHPAPANTAKHTAPYLDAYCGERRTPQNPRGMSCNWHWWTVDDRPGPRVTKTQYAPGDRLWVKESHFAYGFWEKYETDEPLHFFDPDGIKKTKRRFVRDKSKPIKFDLTKGQFIPGMNPHSGRGYYKRPSLFMCREDSRLTLIVTDVRVQRVQEIHNDDAKAEGVELICEGSAYRDYESDDHGFAGIGAAHLSFMTLWDSLNADRGFGWDANPWVSATTFTVHKRNIDQMEDA